MLSTGRFSWLTRRPRKEKTADCADHPEVQNSTENSPEGQVIISDVAEETRGAVTKFTGVSGPFVPCEL
jgi:hypothetical protein